MDSLEKDKKTKSSEEGKQHSNFWIPRIINGGRFIGLTKNGARDKKYFCDDEICVYDKEGNAYYCSSEILCSCPPAPVCAYKGEKGTPDFKCLSPDGSQGCRVGKTRHDKMRKMVSAVHGVPEDEIVEAAGYQQGRINDKSTSINGKKEGHDRCNSCTKNESQFCSHLREGRKDHMLQLADEHGNESKEEREAIENGRYFRCPPPKGWEKLLSEITEAGDENIIKNNAYFEFVDGQGKAQLVKITHARLVLLLEDNGETNVRVGTINSRILDFAPPKAWQEQIKQEKYNKEEYMDGPEVYFQYSIEKKRHFVPMNQNLAEDLLKIRIIKLPAPRSQNSFLKNSKGKGNQTWK